MCLSKLAASSSTGSPANRLPLHLPQVPLLLLAERFDVDLDEALEDKWGRWRHLVTEEDRA